MCSEAVLNCLTVRKKTWKQKVEYRVPHGWDRHSTHVELPFHLCETASHLVEHQMHPFEKPFSIGEKQKPMHRINKQHSTNSMETSDLLKRVRQIEIKTRGLSNNIFAGQYHSAFKGKGMSFSEVREYQYGDDVRDIDGTLRPVLTSRS